MRGPAAPAIALFGYVACASAAGCNAAAPSGATADASSPTDGAAADKRIVVLMIGDGMGRAQLDAASHVGHGATGHLTMQQLPVRGTVVTSGPSGITDSAASATTMASGARAFNGAIGVDRDGQPVETAVELAHRLGLPAGIVSTAALPHATPGAFSAHRDSRHALTEIADDQVRVVRPDVMLGGGARYFLPQGPGSVRPDDGLLDELATAGYTVVRTASELEAARTGSAPLVGLFADEHLTYVIDRAADTTEPSLATMAMVAIEQLDRSPDGFFLMVEGARIDMASHGNLLPEMVGEALEFDRAVAEVTAWAATRPDVTVIVTADHECGGLDVLQGHGAGALPDVTWRWGQHTNAPVDVFAHGPGVDAFADAVIDHRWIHAAIEARLSGTAFEPPGLELLPDGRLADLPHLAAIQFVETGFGTGYNQLDGLRLAADARGLSIGLSGAFQRDHNAIVVLVDVDFGAGTGPATLAGALTDHDGRADAILASLSLDAPAAAGFGADLAIVSWGAIDPALEHLLGDGGLRGLRPPYGQPGDLGWLPVATNFGPGSTTFGAPASPIAPDAMAGFEAQLAWSTLYPTGLPAGATLAIAAVLVNDDGGFTSNQALPSFPPGTPNPGRVLTRLPGVVVFTVDPDRDGVIDPITTSEVR